MSDGPDAGSDFPKYRLSYSDNAMQLRKQLDASLLPALDEIVQSLVRNPQEHPTRLKRLAKSAKVFTYTHPQPPLVAAFEIDEASETLWFTGFWLMVTSVPVLFICYSHKDDTWRDRFAATVPKGVADTWSDEKIVAGKPWEPQIIAALKKAHGFLVVVSPQFLESIFIASKELPDILKAANAEGKPVFWVHAGHVERIREVEQLKNILDYQSPQPSPEIGLDRLDAPGQEEALRMIGTAIRTALKL